MAIAALSFGVPTTPPDAPPSGKTLFLAADGRFFTVLPDGTEEPLGAKPTAHTHEISDVEGLAEALSGTIYSENPPLTPTESMRWVNSTTLRAYEYVGGAWIEIVSS
jgi:hypothetical protein